MRYTDERTYTPSEYVYGYWLAFQSVSTAFGVEIQRSTDDATWTTVVVVYDGKTTYFDEQPMDGVTRYYRGRAVRNGWAPSNWSNSVSGLAVRWLRSEVEDTSVASYAAAVSGTIGVTRGGTGRTSLPTGSLVMGNGSGSVILLAAGPSGSILKSDGTRWITGSMSLTDLTGSIGYNQLPTGSGTWTTSGSIVLTNISSSFRAHGVELVGDTVYSNRWKLRTGDNANPSLRLLLSSEVELDAVAGNDSSVNKTLSFQPNGGHTRFGGPVSMSGELVAHTIKRGTGDGSDNSYLSLNGGGAASNNTRGSWVTLVGNDYGSGVGGQIQMVAGNTGSGDIIMYTGDTVERMRISNAGPITFSSDIVAQTIRRATSDGSDNSSLGIGGGGAIDSARGAWAGLYGNEHAVLGGGVILAAGHGSSGDIYLYTSGSERMRIAKNGTITTYGPMSFGEDVTVEGVIIGRNEFTSYVVDGVFGSTAKPSYITTPNGYARLVFGYDDNGAGQYVPSLGFALHSDNINKSFKILQSRLFFGTPDDYNRFSIAYDGKLEWGAGNATADTNLYRYAANYLATDDVLYLNGSPLYMQATQPILFDFNTHQHTYIREAADDQLVMVVSGTTIANFRADSANGAHGVYLNGWFRNNNSSQGMYNQALGFFWYSEGSHWIARSTSGIRIGDAADATKGYLGYDSTTFGVKDSSNNFSVGVASDRITISPPSASAAGISATFTTRGMSLRRDGSTNLLEWASSGSVNRVLEVNKAGALMANDTNTFYIANNLNYNDSTGWKHTTTDLAVLETMASGVWSISTAGLGSSGSAATINTRLYLTNGGNLHVGYGTDQSYKLAVNGNARATAWFTNSALKYKDNVERFDDREALKIIQATDIHTYTMKADEEKATRVGFIADTAHELLVDKDRDSADIYNTLALAMGAIRALSDQNQALEARIAQLESK